VTTTGCGRAHISQETLDNYYLNRLPKAKRRSAEIHLRSCDQCRMAFDWLNDIVFALREIPPYERAKNMHAPKERFGPHHQSGKTEGYPTTERTEGLRKSGRPV
jgi:hypothetical protein